MNFIVSNLFTIFIVAAMAFFLYSQLKKRKDAASRVNSRKQTEEEDAKIEGRISSSGEVHGNTDYQGKTGEIDWTLRSTVLLGSTSRGSSSVWKRKSMWRTAAVRLSPGKFILLMSTPTESKMGQIKRGGFMNTLINKAADAVLDLYVTGYFGSQYCSLVNIGEDGVKLELEALNDFMILTNHEVVAQPYFDDATISTILNWKKRNHDFSHERQVDQFGLLFSNDGVILTCQANMANAEEVKTFSDFGAALTTKLRSVLAS